MDIHCQPVAALHIAGGGSGGKKTGIRNVEILAPTILKSAGAVMVLFFRKKAAHCVVFEGAAANDGVHASGTLSGMGTCRRAKVF